MAEFTGDDLSGARFERVDLTGAEFRSVDLSRARFRGVDLKGVVMSGVELGDVRIDGELQNVLVNGVDVAPLVEAELDRREPERAKMRPSDPDGFRVAWSIVERLWGDTRSTCHGTRCRTPRASRGTARSAPRSTRSSRCDATGWQPCAP